MDSNNDTVIDPTKFKTSLAKPCNLSTKVGAYNIKQVIQGKYNIISLDTVALSSTSPPHGPYYELDCHMRQDTKEEGASIVDTKLLPSHSSQHAPLLPRPLKNPVSKPNSASSFLLQLPSIISSLLKSTSDLHPPLFKFEVSKEAASHNWDILQQNNFNLHELLNPKKRCITNYGSEFKTAQELEPLLAHHPRWNDLKRETYFRCLFPFKSH